VCWDIKLVLNSSVSDITLHGATKEEEEEEAKISLHHRYVSGQARYICLCFKASVYIKR
jgi:hypothetical protein